MTSSTANTGPPPTRFVPMKPGPQPENQIAATFAEQHARALTPRAYDEIAAARQEVRRAVRRLLKAEHRLLIAGQGAARDYANH